MAGPNLNVVDMQDALHTLERMKRSLELPLFYGQAGKDSITPMNLIKRLEKTAAAAKWDTDEKKLNEFWLTLRNPCLKWFTSLEDKPVAPRRSFGRTTSPGTTPGPPFSMI